MSTRYERLSSRSRRLEVVAAVAAAVFTVVTCQLVPERAADAALQATDMGTAADTRAADTRPGGAAVAGPEPPHRFVPVHVVVRGTGVDADVLVSEIPGRQGLPVAAPTDPMQVAWDATGPAPGRNGAAVLVGHLDSEDGPAAFAGLGGLRPGARIDVERSDDRTARFVVYAVGRYDGTVAPGDPVPAVAPDVRPRGAGEEPRLRLVGTGGGWTEEPDDDTRVVAFARAVRSPAPR